MDELTLKKDGCNTIDVMVDGYVVKFRRLDNKVCKGSFCWVLALWNDAKTVYCNKLGKSPGEKIKITRDHSRTIKINDYIMRTDFSIPGIFQIRDRIDNGITVVLSAHAAKKESICGETNK